MGYDEGSQFDNQLLDTGNDTVSSKLQTDSYGKEFTPLISEVGTSSKVLPSVTISDFDLDDESDVKDDNELDDRSGDDPDTQDESTETFCGTDGTPTKPADKGAELLKKFEAQSPATAKALSEVARQTVARLREGLEGKIPASAEDKRRGIEAINMLGDSVRKLTNPDGSKMSYNDRSNLVAALLNREMARVGLGDYHAVPSVARPRSGEFRDYRIEKTNEKVGDKSLSVTVPFSTLAGVRSDSASASVGVKTKDSYKQVDVWTRKK